MVTKFCTMYVYKITNLVTKKLYIGSRKCYNSIDHDYKYMSSSKYIKQDIIKYGLHNFKKEILESNINDVNTLLNKESEYILKYNTLTPNGYNKFIPNKKIGFHMNGIKHSYESKNKISKSLSGNNNPNFGRKFSPETIEKMRISKLGKTSPRKGITLTDETKKKISIYAKTRIGEKNSMYGKKSWNSGLSTQTDDRLKRIGEKIKLIKTNK